MNLIQYISLYRYLSSEEQLSGKAILRHILRIRRLPSEYKKAVIDIMNGYIPDITSNGVSLEELINKDDMTPIRALLFLDWMRRDPPNAFKYMKDDTIHSGMPKLSEEKEKELDDAIERLRLMIDEKKRREIEDNLNPKDLEDKSDIIIKE